MSGHINLEPIDRVEITTLYENLVDMTMPGGGPIKRLAPQAGRVVSTLLAEEKGIPFVGGHGLSMLVRACGMVSRVHSSSTRVAVRMGSSTTLTAWN